MFDSVDFFSILYIQLKMLHWMALEWKSEDSGT